jgi:hypothetical protein
MKVTRVPPLHALPQLLDADPSHAPRERSVNRAPTGSEKHTASPSSNTLRLAYVLSGFRWCTAHFEGLGMHCGR